MDEMALGNSFGLDANIHLACLETLAGEQDRGSAWGLVDGHFHTWIGHALCASACGIRTIIRDISHPSITGL